jgi:hypothetical protein
MALRGIRDDRSTMSSVPSQWQCCWTQHEAHGPNMCRQGSEQNKCICVVDRYAWPSRPYGILEKETLKHKPTPGTDTRTTPDWSHGHGELQLLVDPFAWCWQQSSSYVSPAHHHVVCTYVYVRPRQLSSSPAARASCWLAHSPPHFLVHSLFTAMHNTTRIYDSSLLLLAST